MTAPFPIQCYGRSLVLQPDGKIAIAGTTVGLLANHEPYFALARYNPNGSLDVSFGTGGLVTTQFADNSNDFADALALQGDGKLVAAGISARTGPFLRFALARYNPDGSLDATFGTAGKVTNDFPGNLAYLSVDAVSAVSIQSNGQILLAGMGAAQNNGFPIEFVLVRYDANGSLDTAFGTLGGVLTRFHGFDWASGLAIQGDGKIVAAGATAWSREDFALARYNVDGNLDGGFGAGGQVTTGFMGGIAGAAGVMVQSDGKLVAAGSAKNAFALARYNYDGSLDASFGNSGLVLTPLFGSSTGALALQADGKIVVAAEVFFGGPGSQLALARYLTADPPSTGAPASTGDGTAAAGSSSDPGPLADKPPVAPSHLVPLPVATGPLPQAPAAGNASPQETVRAGPTHDPALLPAFPETSGRAVNLKYVPGKGQLLANPSPPDAASPLDSLDDADPGRPPIAGKGEGGDGGAVWDATGFDREDVWTAALSWASSVATGLEDEMGSSSWDDQVDLLFCSELNEPHPGDRLEAKSSALSASPNLGEGEDGASPQGESSSTLERATALLLLSGTLSRRDRTVTPAPARRRAGPWAHSPV